MREITLYPGESITLADGTRVVDANRARLGLAQTALDLAPSQFNALGAPHA